MAGKIVGERGGVNMNMGALVHTYVQYEDGSEITVSTSYHQELPEGNTTTVFSGRDPIVLLFEGPIAEFPTSQHVDTVLKALEAESVADLREKLGATEAVA